MRCDFHTHTHYSFDSKASLKDIIEAAAKRGINCLAITDHRETKGALEAEEYAKEKSILIIPGIEIKSRQGDILGLNIKEIIPDRLSAKETIKEIKRQGGTVIIAHPFAFLHSFRGDLKEFLGEIDGIETLNGAAFSSWNKKAQDFAEKYDLPVTAGSDSHSPEFVGRVYLEIPGDNLSIEEVLEAVKDKKGKLFGKEYNFFEKIIDHLKRFLNKLSNFPELRF
ncbi:MAG: CehA/McbA family metallohydrolase [Patescibacteria group bacterium]|nr:CehA/McbA family metallohydrolase [Patescibacteria group bacterium]